MQSALLTQRYYYIYYLLLEKSSGAEHHDPNVMLGARISPMPHKFPDQAFTSNLIIRCNPRLV